MGLSFLNPFLLSGLALVGIPIIIHLLQRRRPVVIPWGAMEFLRLSQRRRSRRLMLEQLLLLLLRCLIIALVVMALSRPVMQLAGAAGRARGPVHAVVLLDNSYSMDYRLSGGEGRTAFDLAKERVAELIRTGLRQGDAVSLVLTSDPPRAVLRAPTLDLNLAARQVERSLLLSDRATDYTRAAEIALEIVRESRFANREVYLFGDSQRSGWESAGDRGVWSRLAERARVVVAPVHTPARGNLSVEWVQPVGGFATAGGETGIQARVVNWGREPVRGQTVELEIDGRREGAGQTLNLEPGAAEIVRFQHLFPRPGEYRCVVRVRPDRLPADDRGHLALRVRQRLRVLLVGASGAASARAQSDPTLFLRLALAPPSDEAASPSRIEPRVISRGELGPALRSGADVVILCDLPDPSAEERRLLSGFVQDGGGLMLFPGSAAEPALYNRELFQATPRLLPARLGMIVRQESTLDPASIQHAALARLDRASDIEPGTARFPQHYRLELDSGGEQGVIARFTGGDAAIVERGFGRGRVVLFAFSPVPAWTDLPLKPAFIPLAHLLTAWAAGGAQGNRNLRVGETLVHPVTLAEGSNRVTIAGPAGASTEVQPVLDARGATARLEDLPRAGFYQVNRPGASPSLYAVNLPAAEGDLQTMGPAEVERVAPGARIQWLRPDDSLVAALDRLRQGIELWRPLLIAALALLLLETALAQIFGRRP